MPRKSRTKPMITYRGGRTVPSGDSYQWVKLYALIGLILLIIGGCVLEYSISFRVIRIINNSINM